jgi:hypothetical protein
MRVSSAYLRLSELVIEYFAPEKRVYWPNRRLHPLTRRPYIGAVLVLKRRAYLAILAGVVDLLAVPARKSFHQLNPKSQHSRR